MTNTKTHKTLSCYVEKATSDKLEAIARDQRRSVAWIIREAIERYLVDTERQSKRTKKRAP